MKNKIKLNKLIEELNIASAAYYNSGNTIMSDREFDTKLKELELLEKETGIVMSNSPTQRVGAPVLNKLDKVVHEHKPMLSLAKTHSAEEIVRFANGKELIAMIKLDGLSVRLTYHYGVLSRAETRGNGIEGSDITLHVKQFENVPLVISNKADTYIVDGEAIITDYDFEAINAALPEGTEKFKNSRNLASGTLSLLDTSLVKERHLRFILWDVIVGDDSKLFEKKIQNARALGFDISPLHSCPNDAEDINDVNAYVLNAAKEKGYPCDGVVWKHNNIVYGESLGQTSHHFNNAIAWKAKQDVYETTLKDIEWSMGKTGILCPVAIFEPVEIDGSTIERASVHNVSILTELDLRPGDTVTIFKANAIIPQISENLSSKGRVPEYMKLPGHCPVCGGATEVRRTNDTDVLVCTNDNCEGKLLGKLSHFASKNAINIDGMSEATLEFMIKELGIKSFKDLYNIPFYPLIRTKWKNSMRFGQKSVDKLLENIERSRETNMERFLYAQSIPLVGRTASKDISKFCNGDIEVFCGIMTSDAAKRFLEIDGFGETMYQSLMKWYEEHWIEFLELKKEFNFINTNKTELNNTNNTESNLEGKTFCITGKLIYCENRDKLVSIIESHNGRYVTGVTSKTNYLVNNDTESLSSKNKKAKELGCKIISEKDLLNMIGII